MFDEVYADLMDAGCEGTASVSGVDKKGKKWGVKLNTMPVGDIADDEAWADAMELGCRVTGSAAGNGRNRKVGFKDVSGDVARGVAVKLFGIKETVDAE